MKDNYDFDEFVSLGENSKYNNDEKAFFYFKKAFEIDPSDPVALGNYLIYEIKRQQNLNPIIQLKPIILTAIDRCNQQINKEIKPSKFYFHNGLFYLLLKDIQISLESYLLGLKFIPNEDILINTLKTLDLLDSMKNKLKDLEVIKKLLLLFLIFRYNYEISENFLKSNPELEKIKFNAPVIILVGTTASHLENEIVKYKENIINAFKNFKGTIISGATISGVSGLAGELQVKYPKSIKTIGYAPKTISSNVELDSRYYKICLTDGQDFSIREPIHYWINIRLNNIDSKNIKLLGIGGGKITFFEYRLALLLKSKIGILEDSGREALNLINDTTWSNLKLGKKKLLKILKNNVKEIEDFILYF